MANRDVKLIKRTIQDFSLNAGEGGGGTPIEEGTGIKITGEDTKTISIDEEIVAKKDDIGDGTITITQGGTTKGTFKLNDKEGTTINLDAGSKTIPMVRTLGSIMFEHQGELPISATVNYEAIRGLVESLTKEHFGTEFEIVIAPDLKNSGLLTIWYHLDSCTGNGLIDIRTSDDLGYGTLSGDTTIFLEEGETLDSTYDLVFYLCGHNTEISIEGSSGSITLKQADALCVTSIRIDVPYEAVYEEVGIDLGAVLPEIFDFSYPEEE